MSSPTTPASSQSYGPSLTNDVRFPIEEVINTDPPLGRTWELVSEDIGDDFEGQAAKTCIEQHGAEILVSIAHQYRTYRDYMMETWQENDSPLGPSVHGGAIPGNLGGKAAEPIFRAQGLDEALGMSGACTRRRSAPRMSSSSPPRSRASSSRPTRRRRPPRRSASTSWRASTHRPSRPPIGRRPRRSPTWSPTPSSSRRDRSSPPPSSRQAAEAGLSLNWIGETGWSEAEFIGSLGTGPDRHPEGHRLRRVRPNNDHAGLGVLPAAVGRAATAPRAWTRARHTATTSTHFSTYDLIVQTALAVEAGGSYKASDWAPAMYEVGEAPGEVCYTYADCLALIREGKDIDYEGITGPGTTRRRRERRHPVVHPVQRGRHGRQASLLDAERDSRSSTRSRPRRRATRRQRMRVVTADGTV